MARCGPDLLCTPDFNLGLWSQQLSEIELFYREEGMKEEIAPMSSYKIGEKTFSLN